MVLRVQGSQGVRDFFGQTVQNLSTATSWDCSKEASDSDMEQMSEARGYNLKLSFALGFLSIMISIGTR